MEKLTVFQRLIIVAKKRLRISKNISVNPYMKGMPADFFSQRTTINRHTYIYNGEKNLGELGPSKDYILDYGSLSSRGPQMYLDNPFVQIIINRMAAWVIGNGLRLESMPNKIVLESEGIKINVQEFSDKYEARYSLLKEMKESSFSKMKCLSELETTAFVNSSNLGDVLVILRVQNGIVNYEIIDGAHVRSQYYGTDMNPNILENGNRIMNGVEMDNSGEHIAYWVQRQDYTYKRIPAKSPSTGLTVAFLYGGLEYRIDNSRSIPLLSGLFEIANQMSEYVSETLASAKEQNKVSFQVVYDKASSGESIFGGPTALMNARDGIDDGTIPVDSNLEHVAGTVQASTGKKAITNAPGGEVKPLQKNESELYFDPFVNTLFKFLAAAAGIPPDVAMQNFGGSFSSARAAIKDFEHSLIIKRYKHGKRFLQPGYELQFHVDVLNGKINAPGYLKAFQENNAVVLAAYRSARWVGDNVPHIDPLKEVNAERAKLGTAGAHIPLTTAQKSTEVLNGGSAKNNTVDLGIELKECDANGIDPADTMKQPKPNS